MSEKLLPCPFCGCEPGRLYDIAACECGALAPVEVWNEREQYYTGEYFFLPRPKEAIVEEYTAEIREADIGDAYRYTLETFTEIKDQAIVRWVNDVDKTIGKAVAEAFTDTYRTCQMLEVENGYEKECDTCGEIVRHDLVSRYCPGCGCRIVRG